MSIIELLQGFHDAKMLFPYAPVRTTRPARRRLFLTAQAEDQRLNPNSATNLLCGRGFIEAALMRWVMGERVYGDKKQGRSLRDLDPPPQEVWEVRVTEPATQGRLFGRFAEPDTLILTGFHTRRLLGNKGSREWSDAMQDCARQWEAFTPALPVFAGSTIHEYVTENCDDFPIKAWITRQSELGKARPRGVRRRSAS